MGREGEYGRNSSLTHDNAVEQCNNAKQLGTSGIIRKQFVAVIVRLATPKIVRRDEIVYLILYQQLYHGFRTRFPPTPTIHFFQCNHLVELQLPYNKE